MQPRIPTMQEKKELIDYLVKHDNFAAEDIEDTVNCAYIAIFDDYVTGGPGYSGKVMVVVYDGDPSQTETYKWQRERNEGEEGLPSGQINWLDGEHEPKMMRAFEVKQ